MLLVPSASPFEIYGASTALLRKFQSSTYHRYASGWNLLSALYLHRLFQKAYGKLYTTCGYWESSTYHFRHGCRWFSTGASSHCELVVKQLYRDVQLLNSLFQKAYGEGLFSERTGMSVVPRRSDVFASQKLASRSVHGCTLLDSLFQKAYGGVCFTICRCC